MKILKQHWQKIIFFILISPIFTYKWLCNTYLIFQNTFNLISLFNVILKANLKMNIHFSYYA